MLKDITDQLELEAQLRHAQTIEAVGTLAGERPDFASICQRLRRTTTWLSATP